MKINTLKLFVIAIYLCIGSNIMPMRIGGTSITVVKGDIIQQKSDAIVNAAHEQLARGDGLCAAIFKAAGSQQLQVSCNQYPEHKGIRCPTGQSRILASHV